MRRNKSVTLFTRVSAEVGNRINAMASPEYPAYRVVRDIIVAHINDTVPLSCSTVELLRSAAQRVGYESADALAVDLVKAFLHTWQYANNELEDNEATPDEDIRLMFEGLSNNSIVNDKDQKGYSIGRRI